MPSFTTLASGFFGGALGSAACYIFDDMVGEYLKNTETIIDFLPEPDDWVDTVCKMCSTVCKVLGSAFVTAGTAMGVATMPNPINTLNFVTSASALSTMCSGIAFVSAGALFRWGGLVYGIEKSSIRRDYLRQCVMLQDAIQLEQQQPPVVVLATKKPITIRKVKVLPGKQRP